MNGGDQFVRVLAPNIVHTHVDTGASPSTDTVIKGVLENGYDIRAWYDSSSRGTHGVGKGLPYSVPRGIVLASSSESEEGTSFGSFVQ